MSAPVASRRIRRILVAFDASAGSRAALESAAALAGRLEAELVGLFVEDVNLLRIAELPFARAISALLPRHRPLSVAEMERALRAQAARAEETMARLLARHAVPWTFRTVRGRLTEALLAAAREADLIALGLMSGEAQRLGSAVRALLSGAPRPVLLAGPGLVVQPPILVLYEGSQVSERALTMAAWLARFDHGRLTVAILAADDDEAERLRSEAASRLATLGVEAEFRISTHTDARSLERIVRAEGAGTLVLGDGSVHGEEKLQELLCRIGCPALLVS